MKLSKENMPDEVGLFVHKTETLYRLRHQVATLFMCQGLNTE